MNKTYYKGIMGSADYIKHISFNIGKLVFNDSKNVYTINTSNEEINGYFLNLSQKQINHIIDTISSINNGKIKLTDEDDVLFKYVSIPVSDEPSKKIIFEVITDKFGNKFGKELYTGLLFPILYNKGSSALKKQSYFIKSQYNSIIYKIDISLNFNLMDKCECFINYNGVADINEVNEYLEVKKHKRKFKKEIEKITNLANKNVFNSEIVPMVKQEVTREKQDKLTIMMENIEFLLEKLGTINSNLKYKYEKEYNLLLDSGEEQLTNNPLNITSLSQLEGKIEYAISYSRTSSSDIVSYLDNLKKEYLNNFISGCDNKTSITLQEIDKLNELFLKMKSFYTLKVQRDVLRNISFIYLMEVYENVNVITKEELENSYFIDNKKSIIITIESLIRAGLIEDNIIIDYNSDFNTEEMLDIISKIKFKQSNENKRYTKILEK